MVSLNWPPNKTARKISAIPAFPAAVHEWNLSARPSYQSGTKVKDLAGNLDLEFVSGAEPTLNGSAAQPGTTLTFSGSRMQSRQLTSADFIANIHKGTEDFTIALIMSNTSNLGTTQIVLDTRGGAGANAGFYTYLVANTDDILLRARSSSTFITDTSPILNTNVNSIYFKPYNLYIWSYRAADKKLFYAVNNETPQEFPAFFSALTADDAHISARLVIGSLLNGSNAVTMDFATLMISDHVYTDFTDIVAHYTAAHKGAQSAPSYLGRYYGSSAYPHPPVMAGQSLIGQMQTLYNGAGQIAFDGVLRGYNSCVSGQNLAVPGSSLLKSTEGSLYWVDDDAAPVYAKGTLFAHLDAFPDLEYVYWQQGSDEILAGTSKADYKAGLNGLIGLLDTHFPQFQKIIINPFHRHFDVTDANAQAVREAIWEVIEENAYAEFGIDTYAVSRIDSVHFTSEGYEHAGAIGAKRVAAIMGLREESGTLPPALASAVRSGTTVSVTLALNGDNTDITVSANAYKTLAFTDDGTEIAITSAVRTGANTFDCTLASEPTGVEKLYCMFGNGGALDAANPDAIRGNGELTLPLRSGSVTL